MLFLYELLEAVSNWFVIKDLQFRHSLSNFLVVREFFNDGIVLEVNFGQSRHPPQVFQLVNVIYIVGFQVKDLKVFSKADVKEVVDCIVRYIKFLQLFEGLNTLHLFQFATRNVEHTHVFKRSAQVAETPYD